MITTYDTVKEFFRDIHCYYMDPVQREYVWSAEKVDRLIDEILKAPVFLGSIAAKCQGLNDKDDRNIKLAKTFDILDGQQRVTTMYMILHVLKYTEKIFDDDSNCKFKYADEYTTNNLMAIKERRYKDLDKRSCVSRVFISLKDKIDKLDNVQKETLYKNVLNSKMYMTPVQEYIDEAKLFQQMNNDGTPLTLDQTVKASFGENGDYNKWNTLMKHIDSAKTGRTMFLKAVAISKNKKRLSKTEITDYYRSMNLNINNLVDLWNYYAPVAQYSLFVKVLTLRMNIDKNKECDKIVNYLKKLDRCIVPYAHEFPNGAFVNDFSDFIMGLNSDFTLKTLKDNVVAYLKNKTDFRKITIRNLRYDVDKMLIIDVLKDLSHDTHNDVKWTIEHIYPQNYTNALSSSEVLHCLGNLTLLRRCKNSSVGNMSPEKKFLSAAYKNSGFDLNNELTEMTHWTEQDIKDRHNKYANTWFDKFFWKNC